MCGRYSLSAPIELIKKKFHVPVHADIPQRFNIAPSQAVLAVRRPELVGSVENSGHTDRELTALEWGYVPEWAKALPNKPLINARIETIAEKPSFKANIKRRRCLLPFTGWYEWKRMQGRNQAHYIHPKQGDTTPHAFAAIWSVWNGPSGEHWLETVAIVTTQAVGPLRAVHSRKPVVLREEDYDRWLAPTDPLPRDFFAQFTPYEEEYFTHYPVSHYVNNVANDSKTCIEKDKSYAVQRNLFDGL